MGMDVEEISDLPPRVSGWGGVLGVRRPVSLPTEAARRPTSGKRRRYRVTPASWSPDPNTPPHPLTRSG